MRKSFKSVLALAAAGTVAIGAGAESALAAPATQAGKQQTAPRAARVPARLFSLLTGPFA